MRPHPIPLITSLLLLTSNLFSQQNVLRLRSGSVIPERNINSQFVETYNRTSQRVNGRSFSVIQFEKIPTQSQRAELAAAGIELLDYVPDNSYTVSISKDIDLSLLQRVKAISLFQLSPEQKMHPKMAKNIFPSWSLRNMGMVELWIGYPKPVAFSEINQLLQQRNILITSTDYKEYNIIGVQIDRSRIRELASYPFIDYVEPAPHGDQLLNREARSNSKGNVLNASLGLGGNNLNGTGITIGVGDDADPRYHLDFTDRLIDFGPATYAYHGTHVHGTVGGAGNRSQELRGYAAKSTLITQLVSGIIRNSPAYVTDHNMTITNNSYGDVVDDCDYNGTYDVLSRILDLQAFSLPNLQHVFASGNDGANTCAPYPASFKTVLGGWQSAKNILTVGATNRNGSIAFFSSRGPVKDGRLKPELTADGVGTISTTPDDSYDLSSGTSMASPGVAGGLALLYERYKQMNGGTNPKSGLMKALICNGSGDIDNNGPDFTRGFGWMNLMRSVDMLNNNRFFNTTVTNLGMNTHNITIPANTAELKVMLYWHDEAAAIFAAHTLVNDLDLELVTPAPATLLPWTLDTLPANVGVAAVNTAADHINNIEQITLASPAAGTYTVNVKGTLIPNSPHEYFVVYDIIPEGTTLTYPFGSETLVPAEFITIQWESYGNPANTFTIEYSTNNGGAWTVIDNNVAANLRQYMWQVPNVPTGQGLVRITRNGTGFVSTSGNFSILAVPTVFADAIQCEGYFGFNWSAVPSATDYEVFMLQGPEMVSLGTTGLTNHMLSGLDPNKEYWVSVRPRIGGVPGRRALAINRVPSSGACTGTMSDFDIRMDSIVAPVYGRLSTSTSLTAATPIVARIKNLDDANVTSFTMRYQVNGGAIVSEPVVATITPGSTYTHTFAATYDFSAVGAYELVVDVINTTGADPVSVNNSITDTIRQLDNQIITLPFLDDIEPATAFNYYKARFGLRGLDRYDYTHTFSQGRLSTQLSTGMAYSGTKSLMLDLDGFNGATGNTNFIYGTYNMFGVDANTRDIRLDFQFKIHGDSVPDANNKIWVRGEDNQPWIEAFTLNSNGNEAGLFKKTPSIEVSDLLVAAGQNFTRSFQVRFGQHGRVRISDNFGFHGHNFDDIRIYEAIDDIALISIDTPIVNSCGLSSTTPVRITIRNASPNTLNNIPVSLVVDGTPVATETIIINPSGLAPNTNFTYTFTATADLSAVGTHTVFVDVQYPTDNFPDNDTLTVHVVNTPLINTFPYLETFESGAGNWYSSGKNNSWQYGTPGSLKVTDAASGTKAWKTSLAGGYNNSELSYLYSPCFNVSGMTNPTLSMNIALDLEDCGAGFCDGAYVEYSSDGKNWTRLGSQGTGTNWYNKNYTSNNLWSVQDYTRWHVATTPLPTGISTLRLRIVIEADPFVTFEGMGVDDIHIYDNTMGIYDGVTMGSPVNQNVSGGTNWIHFTTGGELVASIQPNNQNMGSTDVQAYINTASVRNDGRQYYHDRNITIKPATTALADSAIVRFYFLDTETEALINATGCSGCTKPSDVTLLGVTKYSDPDDNIENGTIADNTSGVYSFSSADWNLKIPFDKGYYVEFRVKDFSEFWLNNGGFDRLTALPVELVSFTAKKQNKNVIAEWITASEQNVDRFEIEVARNSTDFQARRFEKIGEVFSTGNSVTEKRYSFTDLEPNKSGVRYYRLRIVDHDGSFGYSPIRPVVFNNDVQLQVYPNPSSGIFNIVYQLNTGENLVAKVYDVNGRLIKDQNSSGNGFVQKLPLDLSSPVYPAGIYLLQINAGEKYQSFRIVKQ